MRLVVGLSGCKMYVSNSSLHFKWIGVVILIIYLSSGYDDVISEPMIHHDPAAIVSISLTDTLLFLMQRNYRFFYIFVFSMTLLCIFLVLVTLKVEWQLFIRLAPRANCWLVSSNDLSFLLYFSMLILLSSTFWFSFLLYILYHDYENKHMQVLDIISHIWKFMGESDASFSCLKVLDIIYISIFFYWLLNFNLQ
jgi:hypothetical protein